MTAFNEGVKIKKLGYSIHYNPYRNKGTANDYINFIAGYRSSKTRQKLNK